MGASAKYWSMNPRGTDGGAEKGAGRGAAGEPSDERLLLERSTRSLCCC